MHSYFPILFKDFYGSLVYGGGFHVIVLHSGFILLIVGVDDMISDDCGFFIFVYDKR